MTEFMVFVLGLLILLLPVVSAVVAFGARSRLRVLSEENERLDRRVRDLEFRASRSGAPSAQADDVQFPAPPPWALKTKPVEEPAVEPAVEPATEPARGPATEPAATQGASERPAVPAAADERPERSLEAFLGGRVMLVVGVLVLLLGLGFFLRVVAQKGWVGPGARIAMGAAAGVVLLVAGDRLRGRGLVVFGQALMGAGLGGLYLSNYFASSWYSLWEQPTAFALVALVTVVGAGLAMLRDAQLLAWLGFLGAFLAPGLLSENVDALESLTLWLIVVELGLLAVLIRRAWVGLEVLALVASAVYYGVWYSEWLVSLAGRGFGGAPMSLWVEAPERLGAACVALAALLAALLLLCLAPAVIRRRRLAPANLLTILIGSVLSFGVAHEMLFPGSRGTLGTAVLVLGAVFAAASWLLARGRDGRAEDTDSLQAFALAALGLSLPVFLGGPGIVPAWSLAGAAAVYAGVRMGRTFLVVEGAAMIALATANLLLRQLPLHEQAFRPLLNPAFLSAMSPCLAMWLVARILRSFAGVGAGVGAGTNAATDAGAVGRRTSVFMRELSICAGAWLGGLLLALELHDHFILSALGDKEVLLVHGRSAAAAGLAVYSVVLAAVWGRGKWSVPVSCAAPLLAALALAAVVNSPTVRPEYVALWNVPFGVGVTVVLAALAVARFSEGFVRGGALLGALVLTLLLITTEILIHGNLGPVGDGTRDEAVFRAQVYISVAWGLYAAVLLGLGFLRDRVELRWAGLVVFALTLAKILVQDLARLDTVYRIGSFLAVGALLVGASFLYQRRQRSG